MQKELDELKAPHDKKYCPLCKEELKYKLYGGVNRYFCEYCYYILVIPDEYKKKVDN